MLNQPINVLLIDDDREDYLLVKEMLAEVPHYRYLITWKSDWEGALEAALKTRYDVCLVDYRFGVHSGLDLLRTAKIAEIDAPFVLMTGQSGYEVDLEAMEAGAVDYMDKTDLSSRALERTIRYAIKRAEAFRLLKDKTQANERMRIEKESALAANRAKSAFLANMSHEIRTPLGAVLGFIDLSLDSRASDGNRAEWLHVAKRNAEHLSTLIDEILDLSKVEADCLQPDISEFQLLELLNEISSLVSFQARKKSIIFEMSAAEPLPRLVHADRLRLKQILINILNNAVKFTDTGGRVDLMISRAGEALNFRVRDSGIGISKGDRGKLFQPFSQANSSTTRKYGGTGLGLALSKKIARVLGGDLHLEHTAPQKGTTFRLEMPMEASTDVIRLSCNPKLETAAPAETAREADLKGCRVLVIDDSADNQKLVSLYLRRAGAVVEVASNGRDGVHQALDCDVDVVLLDIQMPELDGHQTLVLLKQEGFEKPVIALTAHAMKEERELALREGFTDYLTKPIDKRVLFATIARYVTSDRTRWALRTSQGPMGSGRHRLMDLN